MIKVAKDIVQALRATSKRTTTRRAATSAAAIAVTMKSAPVLHYGRLRHPADIAVTIRHRDSTEQERQPIESAFKAFGN